MVVTFYQQPKMPQVLQIKVGRKPDKYSVLSSPKIIFIHMKIDEEYIYNSKKVLKRFNQFEKINDTFYLFEAI